MRDAVVAEQALAFESTAFEHVHGGLVRGHDHRLHAVKPEFLKSPLQHGLDGLAHDPAAPMVRRKVVDEFAGPVNIRKSGKAARPDELIVVRSGNGESAGGSCRVFAHQRVDERLDTGKIHRSPARMQRDLGFGQKRRPGGGVTFPQPAQSVLAHRDVRWESLPRTRGGRLVERAQRSACLTDLRFTGFVPRADRDAKTNREGKQPYILPASRSCARAAHPRRYTGNGRRHSLRLTPVSRPPLVPAVRCGFRKDRRRMHDWIFFPFSYREGVSGLGLVDSHAAAVKHSVIRDENTIGTMNRYLQLTTVMAPKQSANAHAAPRMDAKAAAGSPPICQANIAANR